MTGEHALVRCSDVRRRNAAMPRERTRRTASADGVTYDTGALIAADRNDRRMWALHAGFLVEEVVVPVPSAVVAEEWRAEVVRRTLRASPRCARSRS